MMALLSAVLPPAPVALDGDSPISSQAHDGVTRRTWVSAPRRKSPATSMRSRHQPSSTVVLAHTDEMQARMQAAKEKRAARRKAKAAPAATVGEGALRQDDQQDQARLEEEKAAAAAAIEEATRKKQQDTYFEWQQCLLDDIREALDSDEENALTLREDHRPR